MYKLTDAQVAQWKKAAEPLTAKWAEGVKKVGVDPDATLKALKAELARQNAAF